MDPMSAVSAVLGVGSLLSGFVGMRAQQSENAAARRFSRKMSDPAFIRKRAERAGFNPLLFVGPSAGLTTPAPGDAGGGALVAGMQGASEVVSAAQALALQKAELEMRNAELERINAQQQFGSAIPGVYGNTLGAPGDPVKTVSDSGVEDLDGTETGIKSTVGNDSVIGVTDRRRTNYRLFGLDLYASRAFSDAETGAEQRFGDVTPVLTAPWAFSADVGNTLGRYFDNRYVNRVWEAYRKRQSGEPDLSSTGEPYEEYWPSRPPLFLENAN